MTITMCTCALLSVHCLFLHVTEFSIFICLLLLPIFTLMAFYNLIQKGQSSLPFDHGMQINRPDYVSRPMRLPYSLSLSLAEPGGHRVTSSHWSRSDASHVSTIREASVCILSNRVTYLLLKTINVKISDAMCHDKNWLVQYRCN